MYIQLFVIVLVIIRYINCSNNNNIELIKTPISNNSNNSISFIISQSFELCNNIADCRYAYEQNDVKNFTIFKYLFKDFLHNRVDRFKELCSKLNLNNFDCNSIYDVNSKTGEEVTINLFSNEILRQLWIYEMSLHSSSVQLCDINHKLVLDKHTLQGNCVCKFDEFCESSSPNKQIFYVMLSFILVLLIGIFVDSVWRISIEKTSLLKTVLLFKEEKARLLARLKESELGFSITNSHNSRIKKKDDNIEIIISNKYNSEHCDSDIESLHLRFIRRLIKIYLDAIN